MTETAPLTDSATTIDHSPTVWTAGQLREALAGLPDDALVHVGVADGPGDFDGYSEYALVDLAPVEKDHAPGSRDHAQDSSAGTEVEYTLFADFKAGQYYRDLA
ncbi:DUF6225 family protein [Streptomyces celluloflavus]|uniref:DUF6225 family protein n=1 Tax=Streptomyces celluloflavus TaxID=58344 RepID=UPI0036813BA5